MEKGIRIAKLSLEAFKEFVRDRSQGMACALAYKQLLAVGPLIGFILYSTGKVFGLNVLQDEVVPLLKNTFTPQLTKVVTYMVSQEFDVKKDITAISIISSILLVWATKAYFGQVKQTIDVTWNKRRYEFGVIPYFKRAIKSFKIAAVTIVIILFFVFVRLLLPVEEWTDPDMNEKNYFVVKISQWVTGFLIIVSVKTFYFTFIPPVTSYWKNVVPAAVLNAILFLIGREFMNVHFSERPDADLAECIIMILIWFYYSNLVFIYSAEFNKLYVAYKQNIDLSALKYDYWYSDEKENLPHKNK